jgi:hypothetical protein
MNGRHFAVASARSATHTGNDHDLSTQPSSTSSNGMVRRSSSPATTTAVQAARRSPAHTIRAARAGRPAPRDTLRPSDLDWVAFRAQHFPGRRPRHDFKAAVAFDAYKRDARQIPESSRGRLGVSPASKSSRAVDDSAPATKVQAGPLEHAALQTWEWEGGATVNRCEHGGEAPWRQARLSTQGTG